MNANYIRAVRKCLGFTQAELADRLGLNRRTWLELESGRVKLKPLHTLALERLALAEASRRGDATLAPTTALNDAAKVLNLPRGFP